MWESRIVYFDKCEYEQKGTDSHHIPGTRPAHVARENRLVLDKAVEITKRTLATGEPVKWSGFGSFIMKDVPPRYSIPSIWKNTPRPKAQSESHSSHLALNNVQPALK